jgi:tetratricopeptide (TPR) repeat protein
LLHNQHRYEKVDELVRDARRSLEELTAQQRENIALLKDKLDLNERQVRAALSILGENDVAQRLSAKLVEIGEQFKALQASASAQLGDDPKVVLIKADAQKAVEAGELSKADALLADVEIEQRRALDRLAVNAAETSAGRGEIALTRLRYAEAATHFADAAAVFPPNSTHEDRRVSYLTREANALYRQGRELGDNDALRASIRQFQRLVEITPRERVPRAWVNLQKSGSRTGAPRGAGRRNAHARRSGVRLSRSLEGSYARAFAAPTGNLAFALYRLGEREAGTEKLQEAVIAYREALKETAREHAPLTRAMIQNHLGLALRRLGERRSGTAMLEEAVFAYREALKEASRERTPLQWAMALNNLGMGLSLLGAREGKIAKLEEAILVYRQVLKEHTRERVPLDWAELRTILAWPYYSSLNAKPEQRSFKRRSSPFAKHWPNEHGSECHSIGP